MISFIVTNKSCVLAKIGNKVCAWHWKKSWLDIDNSLNMADIVGENLKFNLLISFWLKDELLGFDAKITMASCWQRELDWCHCITLVRNFPDNLLRLANFNKSEIYKRLKLQLSSFRDDVNWYIAFVLIRYDWKEIFDSFVVFTVIS